jgi:glucosylceramidase
MQSRRIIKSLILFWCLGILVLPPAISGCKKKSTSIPPEPLPPAELGKASVWLTKGDKSKLLNREGDLSIIASGETIWPVITVDTTSRFQTIDGFGAALTGSSAYLLHQKLDASTRSNLLKQLFDPVTGIGISYLRLSIGASDFSLYDYSYDDMATGQTDYSLQHFSLSVDSLYVIPVLQEIIQISSSVSLIGSPWSPPAWMKTSGSMEGGKLITDCYDVYADYFVRYIQAMKSKGITISAITIQNEPLYFTATYPCMEMQSSEQLAFIKDHLGPKFSAVGINTKIVVYDHNWDNTSYAISILNDPTARQYVAGSAFHAYAGDVSAMGTVHYAHPDKDLYFTEISGGTWAMNFASNLMWYMKNIFIGTTQNWSKCALMWNLVLDQNGAPHSNNYSTCRGVLTLNTLTSKVSYNEEYYSIGHFSKFVMPGAVRIALTLQPTLTDMDAVAFQNTDGSKALVVCNSGSGAKVFSVKQGNKMFSYTLPTQSVVTITW